MDKNIVIDVKAKEIIRDDFNEIIEEYSEENSDFIDSVDFKKYFNRNINAIWNKIENILYEAPVFINTLKAMIPKESLQAVLTDDQKENLKKGAIELVTKKDGSIIAQLRDSDTKKIVANIELKKFKEIPKLNEALVNYSAQLKMKKIAEEINQIKLAVEEVRVGLENDRLALAYSCQQKLIQAMEIKNDILKQQALLSVIHSAEDSRNLLMLSQSENLKFICEQPESTIGKFISGSKQEDIDMRISEIRENLSALNMTSLVSAIGYQVLGEEESMKKSLDYYRNYLDKSYFKVDGLIERLDSMDSLPENYWMNKIPSLKADINELSYNIDKELLIENNLEDYIFCIEGE